MAREKLATIIDLDNTDNKRRLMLQIGTLRGVYEVDIQPRRLTRSLAQNRYWWAVVCQSFSDFLKEQDYEACSLEMGHEILKAKFLMVPLVDPTTGEVIAHRVRSTTELTTAEFSEFMDNARAWLQDFFGIITPDPEPDWVRRPALTK